MNIKRKVESAFRAYLEDVDGLDGLTIVEAHKGDVATFPILIVQCQRAPTHDDLPPGQREHDAELVLQLVTQADDDAETPASDSRLALVVSAMADFAEIVETLNCPDDVTDTEDDDREVSGFHVKACEAINEDGGQEERHWIDSLEYRVVCCDFDASETPIAVSEDNMIRESGNHTITSGASSFDITFAAEFDAIPSFADVNIAPPVGQPAIAVRKIVRAVDKLTVTLDTTTPAAGYVANWFAFLI